MYQLPQTSSHKDNTVGNSTDLPPFNGLIIKNDGQIKIQKLNIVTPDSSFLLVVMIFQEVEDSRIEAKLDFYWPETHCHILSYKNATKQMFCFYIRK